VRKINLKAKNIASNTSSSGGASGQISLIIGILILILAGGLYGGAAYLKNAQAKKIVVVKSEIKTLKKSLDTNKDFKNVYDFQDRLIQLDGVDKNKIKQVNILNQLSQSTLAVDTMKNLKVAVNNGISTIDTNLLTPDLMTVAKQINAYKAVSSQGQVSLKSSGIKDDATEMSVSFTLPRMGIKETDQNK